MQKDHHLKHRYICLLHIIFTKTVSSLISYLFHIIVYCMFITLRQQSYYATRKVCVEYLLATPGMDVNIMDGVSWLIEFNYVAQCVY